MRKAVGIQRSLAAYTLHAGMHDLVHAGLVVMRQGFDVVGLVETKSN